MKVYEVNILIEFEGTRRIEVFKKESTAKSLLETLKEKDEFSQFGIHEIIVNTRWISKTTT